MEAPFDNGTHYMVWSASNCDRCDRYTYDEETGAEVCECDIFQALAMASFGDGKVTEDIAKRMGYTDYAEYDYGWPCPEKIPPWDMDEWQSRHRSAIGDGK